MYHVDDHSSTYTGKHKLNNNWTSTKQLQTLITNKVYHDIARRCKTSCLKISNLHRFCHLHLLATFWQLKPNCCDTALRDCYSRVRKLTLIPMRPKKCLLEIN